MRRREILGAAVLGGIGFTVSLFITDLAFTHTTLISQAGVLIAFTAAGLAGAVLPLTTPAGTADTISPPNEDRPGK
jgi:NhaA family Na+:H+ antiporter